jgi:hypothetical protein
MKKRNNLKMGFLMFFLSILSNCENYNHSVQCEYLDFEKFGRISFLYYNITNNTADTIYISTKNIIVKVIKRNKLLKNEEIKTRGQLIFETSDKNKSRIKIQFEQEKKTDSLKHVFAKKMFYKNFGNNKYKRNKEFIIQCIKNDCMVLIPKQSVIYSKLFNNSVFDEKCKVNIIYLNNKRFTYFVDDTGKKVEINN